MQCSNHIDMCKAIQLRSKIAMISIQSTSLAGASGHGFKTHSQPFLLIYPELLKATVRSVFI